ncbi:MAG: hypothetical protein IKK34_12955 [Clostridia bacterium]|nr:hypothetical protein [Clostridia bacterium]
MAIKTNTTRTVERTSSALIGKCEATEKNMKQLMERAGCAGAAMKSVMLPMIPGSKDDVQYVGLNGADFYFLRGKRCEMPEPVFEILRNTGNL